MRGKILVIEDEMAINDLISMNLEVTGYEVVSCLDGLEAEETLKKRRILICLGGYHASGKGWLCAFAGAEGGRDSGDFLTAKADVQSKVRD